MQATAHYYRDSVGRVRLEQGFVGHDQRLQRIILTLDARTVYAYLKATDPVPVDVLLVSLADRLATHGRKHEEAIARHEDVIGVLLEPALDWDEHGPPTPLIRGDELAEALGIQRGPHVGELLAELAAAQYAGEISTREEALSLARAAAPSPR